jgi:hypothetical protein
MRKSIKFLICLTLATVAAAIALDAAAAHRVTSCCDISPPV